MKIFNGILYEIDKNDVDENGLLDLSKLDVSTIGNDEPISVDENLIKSVKYVLLSDYVEQINDLAFQNFYNLQEINLNNVFKIGKYSFFKNRSLEEVEALLLQTIDEGAFAECDSLSSFITSDDLTDIAPCAFQLCRNLSVFNTGDSLNSVGDYAFNFTKLEKFIAPSVVDVGISAFASCPNLEIVKLGEDAKIGNHSFSNSSITDFYA
ncbi:MAG: leucine-rich repeat domain-containing protein, partial [Clostridia bacterium]